MTAPSHPPSLLTLVKNALRDECSIKDGAALAVAVSGGPDSMALLHCLILLRDKWRFRLLAVSIDHGLRPESSEEVRGVEAYCAEHGVDFVAAHLHLSSGSNVHARAREARYDALWREAENALGPDCFLATAHHKDDRAETVLLRLLRGSSLEGLAVLPARSDRLLRPLIRARRRDVELHVARHGVPFVHDPSNVDRRFLRSRVRHEVLPLLEEIGPGIVEHLVDVADQAGQLPEPSGLSREHRRQLRAALRDPKSAVDVRLPAGLRLVRGLVAPPRPGLRGED